MPDIEHYGRFMVISSYAAARRKDRGTGMRNIALIELKDPSKPVNKIDPRLKAIRQIVTRWDSQPSHSRKARHAYLRTWIRLCEMAVKFNKYWPLHVLCEEWPLPYTVHEHRKVRDSDG